jgi:hypothetical protein
MRHYEVMVVAPVCFLYLGYSFAKLYTRSRGFIYGLLGIGTVIFAFNLAERQIETFTYLKQSHDYREAALIMYREKLSTGKILDIGLKTNEELSRSDYSFFDDPILKYTPGYYCARNLTVLKGSGLAVLSPDIIPGIAYSPASFCTHLLIECGSQIALLLITLLTIKSYISNRNAQGRARIKCRT